MTNLKDDLHPQIKYKPDARTKWNCTVANDLCKYLQYSEHCSNHWTVDTVLNLISQQPRDKLAKKFKIKPVI